jgi:MFS family permease
VPAKLHRNIKLIYSLAFFHSFMIIAPVLVPFFVSKGLSLAEVFYLQAVYATTIVLLEAPSGYFADLFGRRRLLIIGA